MRSLDALAVKGHPLVQVAFDPLEVLGLVSKHLAPMNKLCERAGMAERQIKARTEAVFWYFGLPV